MCQLIYHRRRYDPPTQRKVGIVKPHPKPNILPFKLQYVIHQEQGPLPPPSEPPALRRQFPAKTFPLTVVQARSRASPTPQKSPRGKYLVPRGSPSAPPPSPNLKNRVVCGTRKREFKNSVPLSSYFIDGNYSREFHFRLLRATIIKNIYGEKNEKIITKPLERGWGGYGWLWGKRESRWKSLDFDLYELKNKKKVAMIKTTPRVGYASFGFRSSSETYNGPNMIFREERVVSGRGRKASRFWETAIQQKGAPERPTC